MQALTNRAKVVGREPLTFWESLYIPGILKGMMITFSHIFKKQPTFRYPEQKRPFSPVFRGLHVLAHQRLLGAGQRFVQMPQHSAAHQQVREESDLAARRRQLIESAHRHVDFVADALHVDDHLRRVPRDELAAQPADQMSLPRFMR